MTGLPGTAGTWEHVTQVRGRDSAGGEGDSPGRPSLITWTLGSAESARVRSETREHRRVAEMPCNWL